MKFLSILCAVLFALSLTSCSKDYTCTCTTLGVTTVNEIPNTRKSKAEDVCSDFETTAQLSDEEATCVLD